MKKIYAATLLFIGATGAHAADIVRYPLSGGSKFPIARAVEVPGGTVLIFHSGMVEIEVTLAKPAK